jgi:diguanylate cyclase (GGDEF)-like protein/PAS domain S-box-containing protein
MQALTRLAFGEGNRIGRRLMVMIIGFSSLITLLLSIAQLAMEYRDLRGDIDHELDGVTISVPTIAASLWDFDSQQITLAMESLLRLPNVVHVAVRSPNGKPWEAGAVGDANVLTRVYSLRHTVRGKDTEIGTLTVAASLDSIVRQLSDRAITIVLSNGLKTFLVAIFMATLFRRLVTSRLDQLQKEVVALGPQILPLPETPQPPAMPNSLDEIDTVAWRLEQLSSTLSNAVKALHESQADLRIAATAFESQEGMMITDANSVIVRVNRAFTQITGYSAQEAIGQTPRMLKSGRHDEAFYRDMWTAVQRTGGWQGEIWDKRKDGEIYPKWLTISAVKDLDGKVTHYIGVQYDVTERKRAEERINELAFFDQLTGLPNRTLLRDRLRQAQAGSSRSGHCGALLFIDLDNFKTLNDTLGHDLGDTLLRQVAQRLTLCVRDGDTVARLGGDDFVVVLAGLSPDEEDAAREIEALAGTLLATLNQHYQMGQSALHVTASIGVTVFKGDAERVEDLMKQADLAMYKSKDAGRNLIRFFDPSLESAVSERAALENDLQQAIREHQFLLYYQAQVLDTGAITGAEGLVRWQHPRRGLVPPAEFIPLAEETDLILPLGQWVLETACAQLAAWANVPALAQLTIAVNVSVRQFQQAGFVDQVLGTLARTGANPQRLKLELTEGLMVHNVEDVIAKMRALKALGVGFPLDDFGTGYSSLSYLKQLPLDQLKIDKSFVRDVLSDPNDAQIAQTIVALAQSLGLGVIAEGVETEAQRAFLASIGCHAYQGYLFSHPLPLTQFEALVLKS